MALTPGKAKKMLSDGTVHGRGLTDKQKRYFGAIAGGATPMKKINGGWLDKYAMGGSLPGASGMMYSRNSGSSAMSPPNLTKAQDGEKYTIVPEDGIQLNEVVITGKSNKRKKKDEIRKELFKDMPDFMKYGDDDYTLSAEQQQQLDDLGITDLDSYNEYFGTSYDRENAGNEFNYLNYYKPEREELISSIHGATNEAAGNILKAASFIPIVRGASMATKVPQAYRYLANSPVGRAAYKYIGQPFRRFNNYKPGGGSFSIGNYADAASVGYGGYNIAPDVKELYNNPSWSAAGNVGLDMLSLSPLLNKRFTGAVSGAFRNTPQTSKLNTYYVDQTGRQFNITSPSGASTDALSAAKPNLKSTDLVNFTSTPTAATIANRISKSNSPVARKIIKDELLEISTEASKLREYQREAFKDLSSPEGFQRVVQMEEEYLRSIGYNMNKADVYRPIEDQAKINAQARLREILNANSKNQEAALVAAQMDDLGDEQLMNTISKFFYGNPGKRMYDNASYSKGDMLPIDDLPPWIRREYINTMRNNKGKLPLSTQVRKDPILGGEITIPEIMVGRSWVNNKPIYAHEIIGHGLQKGRKMPQDDWIRNLIEPLDKNSPMWNKNSQKAYEYFMEGSKRREPMAFVQELRQALMDSGIIKNRYDKITPGMIGNAQEFFQTNPMGVFNTSSNNFLSNTRIFDFMSPTSKNFKNLSMILNKLPAALPPVIGAGLLGIDKGENQAPPQMKNGGNVPKAQDGYIVPPRKGVRLNYDAEGNVIGESTHIMKAEIVDGKWYGFPTLFQNEDGTWNDTYEKQINLNEKDWMPAFEEAKRRGELIEFGDDKEGAIKFGEGSWKPPKMKNGGWLDRYEVIEDDMGQLTNPGKITKINSNNITMKGVDFPVLGISDTGDKKMMQPGKDYKFDGNSVTEFPMAQTGLKTKAATPSFPYINRVPDTSPQVDFLKDWTNSTRGQELLSNSFDGDEKDIEKLTYKRINNLDNVDFSIDDHASDFLGRYNRNRHDIKLNSSLLDTSEPKLIGNQDKDVVLHELSHAQDFSPGAEFNRITIPFSDQKLINKYRKRTIKDTKKLDAPRNVRRDIKDRVNYIGDPTETRARLNSIRYFYETSPIGKEEGMPSIFDSEVTSDMLEVMKDNAQFRELQEVYDDEEILELLNTVSDNSKSSGPSNMAYAQEGAGVNKEGVKQYKWFKNYMRSPKYVERLKKEFPDYTDKQIGQEVKSRLENVMQTRVGFLPRSSDISTGVGGVQGVYNADEYPDSIMLRPEYSSSTSDVLFEPGNYLSGYNTIPLHEWSHAADDGGNRMPQSTTDLMLSKMKENSLDIPKDKYYYTRPTEYLGRMQPLRYLMEQEGLYDAGTQDFTKEDLEKAKQNKTIKNNVHFQDLMKNVNSDEDFIELMNTVASVNQKDNSRTMMAKQGRSLVTLDQLTNFTNYNTPQPGGWLDKY